MVRIDTTEKPELQLLQEATRFQASALQVAGRVDLRAVDTPQRIAVLPLTLPVGRDGVAVVFRYGVVVFFNVAAEDKTLLLQQLQPAIVEPVTRGEREEAEVTIDQSAEEFVENGIISLRELSLERLQIVADILAKTVILAHYETTISAVFDQVEALAAELQRKGTSQRRSRELLQQIGQILLIRHQMAGRVAADEKPEILWEHPHLERLYERLADEYEVQERQLALERKLELISDTMETLLELLEHKSSLRVEWYIVILIVIEILLTLYAMFIVG